MGAKSSRWQNTRKLLIAIVIVIALIGLVWLTYTIIQLNGTGLNGYNKVTTATEIMSSPQKKVTKTTEPQPGKTLWDWLGLLALLAVPVVVGFGAAWFTAQQGKVNDRENTDNQREAALQAYIDKMAELLLQENGLRDSEPEDEIRTIARVRTLTVLLRLDAARKRIAFQFLQESNLVGNKQNIVDLHGADLSGANMTMADLSEANLSEADLSEADLRGSDLRGANLSKADLRGANLSKANLRDSSLRDANLSWGHLNRATLADTIGFRLRANLSEADLRKADLINANLYGANLRGANLSEAVLTGANLSEAVLTGAAITEVQLKEAASLKGATMPDGSIHP